MAGLGAFLYLAASTVYVRRHVDLSEPNVRTWTRNFTIRDHHFQFVRFVRFVRSVRSVRSVGSTNFFELHLVRTDSLTD